MTSIDQNKKFFEEEKPLIELPRLIIGVMAFTAFMTGLSLLIMPVYLAVVLFLCMVLTIAIVLNPFVSILVYAAGAFLKPLAFAPELATYQITVVAGFGMMIAWAIHVIIYRDFKTLNTWQLVWFSAFAIASFFSALAYWEESNFMFFELVKVLIVYFLTAHLVKSRKQVFIIVYFIVILGCISAGYALYQQISGIGMPLGGGVFRPTSFEGDPNYLALDMVILLPFVLGLLVYSRSVILRAALSGLCLLFMATVTFTFSRAGVLGLGVVMFFFVWKFFPGRQRILLAIGGITSALLSIPYLPIRYLDRLRSIIDLSEVSIKGRLDGLIVGLWLMKDHPFVGIGIGRWPFEYWQRAIVLPGIQTKVSWFPHNVFVEIGSQTGILALLAYGLLLIFIFKDLDFSLNKFKSAGDRDLLAVITQSLQISMIGFLVCGLFVAAVYLKLFWLLAGFSVAIRQLAISSNKKNNNQEMA